MTIAEPWADQTSQDTTDKRTGASGFNHWYAIATRSRHEHSVEKFLCKYCDESWVPLIRTWSSRLDRRKQIDLPAIPGYMLIRCDLTPELRTVIKKSPGVVAIVTSAGQPSRIPRDQINSLKILLGSSEEVFRTVDFVEGQTVKIKSGPMKGAYGLLSRVSSSQNRLVVKIDHVGLALTVNIHESDVEIVA